MDSAVRTPVRYVQTLEIGLLGLIKEAKNKLGAIPSFIKYVLLYELNWIIKQIINNQELDYSFLSPLEKQRSFELIEEILSYIEIEFIETCPIECIDQRVKQVMIEGFKKGVCKSYWADVLTYNLENQILEIKFETNYSDQIDFIVNNSKFEPLGKKSYVVKYFDQKVSEINYFQIKLLQKDAVLECGIYNTLVEFVNYGKRLSRSELENSYKSLSKDENSPYFKC